MPLPYLESLLITVDLFGGLASAAFALPENNDRHLFKSAGESSSSNPNVSSRAFMNRESTDDHKIQSLKSASIGLYFNQQPKDITRGFVFGSDPRSCDVLLANTKGTGISANHFSISIDWASRIPIITSCQAMISEPKSSVLEQVQISPRANGRDYYPIPSRMSTLLEIWVRNSSIHSGGTYRLHMIEICKTTFWSTRMLCPS